MRKVFISLVTCLVAMLGLGFNLSPALAHTSLIASNPADGANLDNFPRSVSLEFSENLLTFGEEDSNYFEVSDEKGTPVELKGLRVDGARMTANLVHVVGTEGRFQVRYRAVSGDGHVIRGSIYFTVDEASTAASSRPVLEPSKSDGPFPSSRIALGTLIALALLAGLAIYRGASRRDSTAH